jgi:recombinational DNA repair protein (RecF pathway)
VQAVAQGIRLEKSKLRYHTQEYSFGIFSLVRGKEYWRLTSAQESGHTMDRTIVHQKHHDLSRGVLVRMTSLLKRLLHGEEPNAELFHCLESAVRACTDIPTERLPELESLTALRILNILGYIGQNDIIQPFVTSHPVSSELLQTFSPLRPKINGIINASLQASHL